jgi:hypothetical protein
MSVYIKAGVWADRTKSVTGEFNLTKYIKENSEGGGGVPEAPINDSPYLRQNATWVIAPTTLEKILANGSIAEGIITLMANSTQSTYSGDGFVVEASTHRCYYTGSYISWSNSASAINIMMSRTTNGTVAYSFREEAAGAYEFASTAYVGSAIAQIPVRTVTGPPAEQTLASLNAAYPGKPIGFSVQCLVDVDDLYIYTKTAYGWVYDRPFPVH